MRAEIGELTMIPRVEYELDVHGVEAGTIDFKKNEYVDDPNRKWVLEQGLIKGTVILTEIPREILKEALSQMGTSIVDVYRAKNDPDSGFFSRHGVSGGQSLPDGQGKGETEILQI